MPARCRIFATHCGNCVKSPGFTAVAVITLALGIGATTAMFSLVDRTLFHSLPYPRENELVSVGVVAPIIDGEFLFAANYLAWREHQTAFSGFTSSTGVMIAILPRVAGARCVWLGSFNLFADVWSCPVLGADFTAEEDRRNSPKVALLKLWALARSLHGADRGVLDRTISSDGRPTRIIGVLPQGF